MFRDSVVRIKNFFVVVYRVLCGRAGHFANFTPTPSTDYKLIIDVYKGLKKKERSFTCLIKAVACFNAYIKIYRVKQKQMKNAFSRRRLGLCTAGFIIAN